MIGTSKVIVSVIIAVMLVIAGHLLVIERRFDAEMIEFRIGYRNDTPRYIRMAQEFPSATPAPFRYRILIPGIIRTLELPTYAALYWFTNASLALMYVVLLLGLHKLGYPLWMAFLGVLALWFTRVHLFNFHNPHLIDAPTLLLFTLGVFMILLGVAFRAFLALVVVGMFLREATIFLTLGWLACYRRLQTAIVIAVALGLLFGIRAFVDAGVAVVYPTGGLGSYLQYAVDKLGYVNNPLDYVINFFRVWNFKWFLFVAGILLITDDRLFFRALFLLGVLVVAAAFSAFIAVDTDRVAGILSPLYVLGMTHLFYVLYYRYGQRIARGLCGILAIEILSYHDIFTPITLNTSFAYLFYIIMLPVTIGVLVLLRHDLLTAGRRRIAQLPAWGRALLRGGTRPDKQ